MKYIMTLVICLFAFFANAQIKYVTNNGTYTIAVNADGSSDTLNTAYQIVGEYMAILSHQNTDNPTIRVLKNTLGSDVTWTYTSTGNYTGTVSGITMAGDKTWCTALLQSRGSNPRYYVLGRATDTTVVLTSMNSSFAATDPATTNYVAVQIIIYQ